jgi:hypothetical protein
VEGNLNGIFIFGNRVFKVLFRLTFLSVNFKQLLHHYHELLRLLSFQIPSKILCLGLKRPMTLLREKYDQNIFMEKHFLGVKQSYFESEIMNISDTVKNSRVFLSSFFWGFWFAGWYFTFQSLKEFTRAEIHCHRCVFPLPNAFHSHG